MPKWLAFLLDVRNSLKTCQFLIDISRYPSLKVRLLQISSLYIELKAVLSVQSLVTLKHLPCFTDNFHSEPKFSLFPKKLSTLLNSPVKLLSGLKYSVWNFTFILLAKL